MATFLDIVLASCGAVLVVAVFYDVFQTVVLPRWASRNGRIGPWVIRAAWRIWQRIAWRISDAERREDFFGSFAPFSLVLVLVTWLITSIFGYGLMLHALRGQMKPALASWGEAFYAAGSALLTIGFGDFVGATALTRLLTLMAGASGLTIVALVISWTFTLYTSFERREVPVVMLDQRAGAPPSGLMLLETYAKLGMRDRLPNLFEEWEIWAAQVLESHIAYPILPFFRSSHNSESWVSALGAVADAATLVTTTVVEPGCGQARLMNKMAAHALLDLGNYFGLDKGEGAGVERREWDEARRRLAAAGYTLRPAEEGWRRFSEVRGTYVVRLNAMARFVASPPTQWIGDRSVLPHRARHEHQHAENMAAVVASTATPPADAARPAPLAGQ